MPRADQYLNLQPQGAPYDLQYVGPRKYGSHGCLCLWHGACLCCISTTPQWINYQFQASLNQFPPKLSSIPLPQFTSLLCLLVALALGSGCLPPFFLREWFLAPFPSLLSPTNACKAHISQPQTLSHINTAWPRVQNRCTVASHHHCPGQHHPYLLFLNQLAWPSLSPLPLSPGLLSPPLLPPLPRLSSSPLLPHQQNHISLICNSKNHSYCQKSWK